MIPARTGSGLARAKPAERQAQPELVAPLEARILIVVDDAPDAFAAVQALETLGRPLVVARSDEEALARLHAEAFAVILLDLTRPGPEGDAVVELIGACQRASRTPIVILTPFRDEAHVFRAYSAGAVDVVFKPVVPLILQSKVAVLVDLHLKTEEVTRQSACQQRLLDEHARVKAEAALTECALRQAEARKMEAVGQLTGGVAHDFNNLLTVVLGNVDALARKAEDEARRARRIDAVRQAAERGRDLTRQLLAFSRRQHLSPVTVDVNLLIGDFAPLIRQAVGEAVTVELSLPGEPLCAHVDPTQLKTALLNLAVNARDAMPEGGRLTIRATLEAAAGWVTIEVEDTGVGMSPNVRDRVFEPFFTTKDVGRGSGLGLSQVYGFVRQSEGEVLLDSVVGQGSSVRLRLPHSGEAAQEGGAEARQVEIVGRGEKILLVEDDATVLPLTLDLLTGLGYRVTCATNAAEALEILQSPEAFDLLFTDVVMPGGVSGVSLARIVREMRPGLAVLLSSGFLGESSAADDVEFPLLDKPYEASAMATKVRELLDARLAPAQPGRSRPQAFVGLRTAKGTTRTR